MSPEEARAALPEVRQTLTHLMALDGVGAAVRLTYEKALSGKE